MGRDCVFQAGRGMCKTLSLSHTDSAQRCGGCGGVGARVGAELVCACVGGGVEKMGVLHVGGVGGGG